MKPRVGQALATVVFDVAPATILNGQGEGPFAAGYETLSTCTAVP